MRCRWSCFSKSPAGFLLADGCGFGRRRRLASRAFVRLRSASDSETASEAGARVALPGRLTSDAEARLLALGRSASDSAWTLEDSSRACQETMSSASLSREPSMKTPAQQNLRQSQRQSPQAL